MQTADCVAIYDWATRVEPLAWVNLALDCFERAKLKPNVIMAKLPSGNKKNFRSEKRLQAYISSSPVQSLGLYATLPNYAQLVFGWRMTAGANWNTDLLKSVARQSG